MGSAFGSCGIMEEAPIVIMVWNAGEMGWETEAHSVAAAIQNMLLKAYSLGLGSSALVIESSENNRDNRNRSSHLFGVDMKADFSLLCGYSYAWRVGYKPKSFDTLERIILSEAPDIETDTVKVVPKNRELVEQLVDSYGKLGFLFLSTDYIQKTNGKVPLSYIYVSYHLFNFIYDCKAFLDAVAVMVNDFYSIGETRGDIDFKHQSFRDKVIEKERELEKIISKYKDWFVTVATWRDNLIHKFSASISPFVSVDHWPTKEELNVFFANGPLRCVMPMEPRPYLSPNFKELKKKYGKAIREIEPFCKEWVEKASDFYDQVCSAISQALE